MTRQEVAKLIAIVRTNYMRFFKDINIQSMDEMISGWAFTLEDLTYEQASMGLKIYMVSDTSGFPPSPGQIIDCYRKSMKNPAEEITAAEAWEYVWRAMENLRWDMPDLAFEQLPKKVQKVIGTASGLREMAMMDANDLLIGEKARFIHAYNAYTEREEEYMKIPETVRNRIENATYHQERIGTEN